VDYEAQIGCLGSMLAKTFLVLYLVAISCAALAQRGDGKGDERWNITGPSWYDTPCGHVGFSVTHSLPYANSWRKPCSVPIRVCEYKTLTMSYPADPDVPCELMLKPTGAGELLRTYLKRWD
jgi:hypothetical protein